MEYAVTMTPRQGYLHVRVRGDNNLETIRRYVDEVLAACAAGGVGHVLLEECLEGSALTLTDVFQVVCAKVDVIRSVLRLIAFVDVHPDRSPANIRFGETVAVNRGLEVRVFESVTEAESWLSGEIVRRTSAGAPGSTGRTASGTGPAAGPARA